MKNLGPCSVVALAATVGISALTGAAHAADLGEILLQKGVITRQELDQAREEERRRAAAAAEPEKAARSYPEWLDRITPFGDLRTRHEGFYANDLHARNRFRLRARLGLKVVLSEELTGGVRIASGNIDDPISTNQSFEKAFTRKPLNLDQAYLTVAPGKTFHIEPGWVAVTAGKFGANAYRTSELLWDDDLSPEGATETLTLVNRSEGVWRSVKVNAFQWVVDEVSAGGDPWMAGGQVVAAAALGGANATLAVGDFHYQGLNRVARTLLEPSSKSYDKDLAASNTLATDSGGTVIGYASGFNVLHGGAEITAADPLGLGIPGGIYGDVAHNTQAHGRNVGFYAGAGIGSAGGDYYHDALKAAGDWGLAYTFAWVEKDAVPSLFSYSDIDYVQAGGTQKGSTNVSAHIVRLDYALFRNVQLTAKAHLINALDRGASNASLSGNPTLLRTQLDMAVKF